MASMIPRKGLRFAESKCPSRLFSARRRSVPSIAAKNGQDLHEDITSALNPQNGSSEARKANIATTNAFIARSQASQRSAEMQAYANNFRKPGELYAPHDLSPVEVKKRGNFRRPNQDIFDVLGMNPLLEYKNPSIMWEYMAPMGRIRHRNQTGLRPVNQRRISKAIRRAVGMGLIPSVHPHPEVLEAAASKRERLALRSMSSPGSTSSM
ncbi:hypothetical protein MMC07_008485 [Pseudocyphellaria aurata]|nr:hypothetical protein [Pseudocyphellaria aurata]